MGKKTKKGKGRLDKYYHLAKEQGYRSRAAFKLIQLNRKYHFLEDSRSLLDLCAAPGGWLQVAAKTMPVASLIVGIDLVAIKPIRGVKTLQGDITTQKARQDIKKESKGALFDTVIHDGAPNVGGAWTSEAYNQAALVLESCKLACDLLRPGGTFVTKVFRSREYQPLMYAFQQLFDKVEATKPPSSRSTSAEIFVVCLKYKAPAKIDPRLLDHKVLFQEVEEAPRHMGPDALLKMRNKQRRFREGYEDGISTTHKAISAAEFVLSEHPADLLGRATTIALDGPQSEQVAVGDPESTPDDEEVARVAAMARGHKSTTDEIRSLCADLLVLGRSELRQLLKWRGDVRKKLDAERKAEKADKGEMEGDGKSADEEDGDEALLREMAEIKERMEERSKRDKKKARELKKKRKIRAAQTKVAEAGKKVEDDDLFDLKRIKTRAGVETVAGATVPEPEDFESSEEEREGMEEYADEESSSSDGESEEEDRLRYEELMEEMLERSHKQQAWRAGELRKREEDLPALKKHRLEDGAEEIGADGVDAERLARASAAVSKRLKRTEEVGDGGLVVEFDEGRVGVASSKAAMARQWFADDEMKKVLGAAGLDDEEEEEEEESEEGRDVVENGVELTDSDEEEEREINRLKEAVKEGGKGGAKGKGGKGERDGFEVVRAESPEMDSGSESSDSEDEFETLPDSDKAEVLALAKRMLRGGSAKRSIMEAAYNRYAFHDDNLPEWFREDEEKNMRPIDPVTKEEIEEEKARLRAIDARPLKKVAEAKARKKKRAAAALAKARAQANAVADQEDVPMKARMREIERIYAKANAKGKGGKGGKGAKGKKKGPPMDRRMKNDLRSQKRADKKKAKGRKAKRTGVQKGGVKKGRG